MNNQKAMTRMESTSPADCLLIYPAERTIKHATDVTGRRLLVPGKIRSTWRSLPLPQRVPSLLRTLPIYWKPCPKKPGTPPPKVWMADNCGQTDEMPRRPHNIFAAQWLTRQAKVASCTLLTQCRQRLSPLWDKKRHFDLERLRSWPRECPKVTKRRKNREFDWSVHGCCLPVKSFRIIEGKFPSHCACARTWNHWQHITMGGWHSAPWSMLLLQLTDCLTLVECASAVVWLVLWSGHVTDHRVALLDLPETAYKYYSAQSAVCMEVALLWRGLRDRSGK